MMRFPIIMGKCQKWQPVTTNQMMTGGSPMTQEPPVLDETSSSTKLSLVSRSRGTLQALTSPLIIFKWTSRTKNEGYQNDTSHSSFKPCIQSLYISIYTPTFLLPWSPYPRRYPFPLPHFFIQSYYCKWTIPHFPLAFSPIPSLRLQCPPTKVIN